jgi:diguanylate cyclase (GGDEF)-like protein
MHTLSQIDILGFLQHLQATYPALHAGLALCVMAVLGLFCLPIALRCAVRAPKTLHVSQTAELEQFRSARRDHLTSLPNRTSFSEALATRLQSGTRAALVLIDLDGFKSINTVHGHRLGDDLLVAVSGRLRKLLPGADQIARLGGNEFGILLSAAQGRDAVEGAALNILRTLMAPVLAGTRMVECSVSIGMALLPDHALDADNAFRAAYAALDDVKNAGGGGFRFFNPKRDEAALLRGLMKEELRSAIPAGEIIPYYQPIVDLQTGDMIGLEVLARWNHPTRGVLVPDLFIPLAEEMDLAGQITQCLMRRVVRDSRDWPAHLYYALNVSPGQLRELIGMVRNPPVWQEGEMDPRRLEIEVTESALIEDLDLAREMMLLMQARGTRVVLDDFGIGHSNFFHLRELPFDRIKIDKSFIIDSATDPRAEACVRAMLALGVSLGIEMVAEGIETAALAEHLTQLGCHYGQGFVYSPPVPAHNVYGVMRQLRRIPATTAA